MLLFKNATIYKFVGEVPAPETLMQHQLRDPEYGEIVTTGFTFADGEFFSLGIATKVLPPSLVKKLTAAKIAYELKASGEKKMGKELKQTLKEAVIAKLLETALVKYEQVDGYFGVGYLVINSPSVKNCELLIEKLYGAMRDSSVASVFYPLEAQKSPQQVLAAALLGDNQLDDSLVITDNVALYDMETPGTTVKASSHPMDEDILQHVRNGMQVQAISLCMNDRLNFVLTKSLQIKSIKFSDLCFEDEGDKEANDLIMKSEISRLIEALDLSFGLSK